MNYQPFARKHRQIQLAAKQLEPYLKKKTLRRTSRFHYLVQKLRRLYRELSASYSQKILLRTLGVASVFIVGSNQNVLQGQTFSAPQEGLFDLKTDTNRFAYTLLSMADLDGDGDADMLISTLDSLFFRENIGTVSKPKFSERLVGSPFNLNVNGYSYEPCLGDLDDDGDLDLVMFVYDYETYDSGVNYFENTGSAEAPSFTDRGNRVLGISPTNPNEFPVFAKLVDLDDDGDLDYIAGAVYGDIIYYENIGTAFLPQFAPAQTNPFGIVNEDFYLPDLSLVDLDKDGDLDLIFANFPYTEYESHEFVYIPNIGSASNPRFGELVKSPFNLSVPENVGFDLGLMCPEFVDLDNDGDLDILSANSSYDSTYEYTYLSQFYYYENGVAGLAEKITPSFELYPNPCVDAIHLKEPITGAAHYSIIDVEGKVVQRAPFTQHINVSELPSGLYRLQLENEKAMVMGSELFIKK